MKKHFEEHYTYLDGPQWKSSVSASTASSPEGTCNLNTLLCCRFALTSKPCTRVFFTTPLPKAVPACVNRAVCLWRQFRSIQSSQRSTTTVNIWWLLSLEARMETSLMFLTRIIGTFPAHGTLFSLNAPFWWVATPVAVGTFIGSWSLPAPRELVTSQVRAIRCRYSVDTWFSLVGSGHTDVNSLCVASSAVLLAW